MNKVGLKRGRGIFLFFSRCLRDPRIMSLELKIESLESEKIGSLQVHTGYLTFSLKKNWISIAYMGCQDKKSGTGYFTWCWPTLEMSKHARSKRFPSNQKIAKLKYCNNFFVVRSHAMRQIYLLTIGDRLKPDASCLDQRSPNYGSLAKSVPRRHSIRPQTSCQ